MVSQTTSGFNMEWERGILLSHRGPDGVCGDVQSGDARWRLKLYVIHTLIIF